VTTEEQSFWDAIAADPNDTLTMLVFADWLEDREDCRSEGIRALVEGEYRPSTRDYCYWGTRNNRTYWPNPMSAGSRHYENHKKIARTLLPNDWFLLLLPISFMDSKYWRYYKTVPDALNDAALAFSRLPYERRQELLKQEVLA
jgi:uncharacterized protein (TIGR02996 family)